MEERLPAGLGSPCDHCGRVQLVDPRGREYCLPCADPISDVPLVPVTWSWKQFWRIHSAYKAYERALSKYTIEELEEKFPPPKYAPSKRGPHRPEQFLVPWLQAAAPAIRTARGGAPQKLKESDLHRLRRMLKDQSGLWTLKMLAERFPDKDGKPPHPRTIRRALKKLGLKLKKRPARRS